jgi:hypothetical protein
MNKVPNPSQPEAASEGIVVGSVLVRIGAENSPVPFHVASVFMVPARSIRFSLEAGVPRDIKSIMERPIALEKGFLLNVVPGEEKTFVTRMPAGPHVFVRLVPRGYEESAAPIGIRFSVVPGTTTYIGRVIFEVPEKLPLGKGMPAGFYSLKPAIRIEDAQDATIGSLKGSDDRIGDNVVKNLMRAE